MRQSAGQPKRILMTADTVGGVWTYALELIRAFGHSGVEFALATMGPPATKEQRASFRRLKNAELFESRYKLEWMEEPWEDVRAAGEWLFQLAEKVAPDVVHLNGYAHGALEWNRPALVVGHSCVLSWWESVKGGPAPSSWSMYERMVRGGLQAAGAVAAPSRTMLNYLERFYGPLPRPIVVPNGCEPSLFHGSTKEPLILGAGRLWDEAKNMQLLARAAALVSWRVALAGEYRHPDGGRIDFSRVCWLGRLASEELARWYGKAAIFCLPARYEPFGLSSLEAALSGCALVLGDIPSLREVWGDAACYVNPGDAGELASVLQDLIRHSGWREEMSAKARARAREYGPERMAAGYRSIYEELMRPVWSGAEAKSVPIA